MGFQIGEQIGDYSIVEAVGAGGAGQVFKVEHRITGRVEAMKVLLQGRMQSASPAERFQREIKLQASLNHPNIASVHNAFWVRDELVMVMELVEGASLDAVIAEGPLSPRQTLRIGRQALMALEYAHERGITHRDIKPENIMVDSAGVVKLMDFGLAKDIHDQRLTQTGAVVGSLFYISPEQAQGLDEVDHRSDIYSLGAVLYQTVTGKKPFARTSSFALLQAAVREDPEPPINLCPEMSVGLNNAILRAMAKDPGERFQTAHEFRAALESIEHDPARSSTEIRLPKPAPPPPAVVRRKLALRAAAFLIGILTFGLLAMRSLSETPLANEVRTYQQEAEELAAGSVVAPSSFSRVRTVGFGETLGSAAVAANAARAAVVVGGSTIQIVDSTDGAAKPIDAGGPVSVVALSGDGALLATAGALPEAVLWDVAAGTRKRRLSHAGAVTALAFSDDGEWVASGSADGTIRVWSLLDPADSVSLPGTAEGPAVLSFSPGGGVLAAPAQESLRLWPLRGDGEGEPLSDFSPSPDLLAFSASGLELSAVQGRRMAIWDLASREVKWAGELESPPYAVARGKSGPWIALLAGDEQALEVWDAEAGELLAELALSSGLRGAFLSPDAARLAAVTEAGDLELWRAGD